MMVMTARTKMNVTALTTWASSLLEVEVLLTWQIRMEGISIKVHLDVLLGHHRDAIHGLVNATENRIHEELWVLKWLIIYKSISIAKIKLKIVVLLIRMTTLSSSARVTICLMSVSVMLVLGVLVILRLVLRLVLGRSSLSLASIILLLLSSAISLLIIGLSLGPLESWLELFLIFFI